LQNRQIGRLGAFDDAAGIDGGLAKNVRNAGPVTHQQAGHDRIVDKVASGHAVACCERGQLRAAAGEIAVRRHEHGIRLRIDDRSK
jgi:hypothetical protein